MKIEQSTLVKLINAISMTKDIEIGCEECFQQMDVYVEMLRAGKEPKEVMPLVQDHLNVCSCCSEEFQALIEALDAAETEE